MTVSVADIRTRTYVLHIAARTPEGNDVFHAVLTPICIVQEERRAINIPAPFKAALEKYRAACFAARVGLQPKRTQLKERLMKKLSINRANRAELEYHDGDGSSVDAACARNRSAWSLHLSFQPNAHAQSHQGGA